MLDFVTALKKKGVTVEHKYSPAEPSKIIGTFYVKDGKKFPSSKIDKRYTYSGLLSALKRAEPIKSEYRGEKPVGNHVKRPPHNHARFTEAEAYTHTTATQ